MSTNTLKIGSILPEFNLWATDDNNYSSESFPDKKAVLVLFSCNHCPYVRAYEKRIIELADKYKGELIILAINSNDAGAYPEDSFEKMKERAKEQNFNFIYCRDEDQTVAKKFDATHTPEFFLFNEKRVLVYHGKMDDNWQDALSVKTRYLETALIESLRGETVSAPETYSIGCTIKWKNK